MKSVIKNCRIVSPGVDIECGSIEISDGMIADICAGRSPVEAGDINGEGLIACPGFIDIHSHGRSNYDFCDGSTEAMAAIGRDKLADGVTGFLATGLSVAVEDLEKLCETAEWYKANVTDGATLLGVHLEGPFFNPACAGAQNPAFLKLPDIKIVDKLHAISPVVKVSFSPELEGALEFTAELNKRGIMPSGGHTEATYERYTECRKAGMKHLTHFCNVMTPLHHLRFGIVGGALLDDDVYVEMICDGVHLCEQMIQLTAKNKGVERMMIITDSMRAAGMPDGDYSLGGLPVVVRDGCARLTTGQVAGSTLRFHNGLKHLLKVTGLPLCEVIRTTSLNQAESLKLGRRGKLEKDFAADIVMLDENLNPAVTICGGEIRWKTA
jgi:N-acetylglucosamine-6-phosphate deacetylase